MVDPALYDPPEKLEGANAGLIEAVAERLWRKRSYYSKPLGDWEKQSHQVKYAWRETARDVLSFLFEAGFTGPAGPPPSPMEGISYSWLWAANEWEIHDADGGLVALVGDHRDLRLMMAAPAMRAAIRAFFESLPPTHPVLEAPEVKALAESLPDL